MTPIQFLTEFRGILRLCGEEPPTQEQWTAIREMAQEAVGKLVADKILEQAEEIVRKREQNDALESIRQIYAYQQADMQRKMQAFQTLYENQPMGLYSPTHSPIASGVSGLNVSRNPFDYKVEMP